MTPRFLMLGALLLLAQAAPAATPEPLPLTLQQALQTAYERNPDLRAAGRAIGIADGERLQAGLLPNPELALETEGTDSRSRVETVAIAQTIELGGKRGARIALADQERLLALEVLRARRTELRADVMAAYFNALTAQERVLLTRSAIEVAGRALDAATRRVAAGKISPVEQTRSRVAEATVKMELTQATADLARARRKLAALMGSADASAQPLVTPALAFAIIPTQTELEARLDAAPRLRQARLQVAREEAQIGVERALRTPDLRVSVGSQRDRERGGDTQTVLGLSVPLPLFNRNQGKLAAALQRADQARDTVEAERLRLHADLLDARERLEVSQIQLDSLTTDVLPAARQAYDAAVTGFELGKFGFLDVLDTQRALIAARTQYLQALLVRYLAAADLERIVPTQDAPPFKEHVQ